MQGAGAGRETGVDDRRVDEAPAEVVRGRLRLQPVEGRADSDVHEIEIDLSRPDAVLTLGDLRRAAEQFESSGRHETAHRLWRAVAAAADELDGALARWAVRRANGVKEQAAETISENFRRCNVRYDYLALARDRASGLTASETARRHGCSPSTVARAVDFATRREEIVAATPDLFAGVGPDVDPATLAAAHGVDLALMRWMVAVAFDRRSSGR